MRFDEAAGNPQTFTMSRRLELPDDLVADLQQRATQEGRGLDETAAQLLREALGASAVRPDTASMLAERKRIANKFLTGEWGVELA
jgi:plasmid stability protein